MRRMRLFAIVGVATICSAGVALATHVPQVDPATVPTGFLAAHNKVDGIRISSIERAVEDGKPMSSSSTLAWAQTRRRVGTRTPAPSSSRSSRGRSPMRTQPTASAAA
jgi:hypothetical protein